MHNIVAHPLMQILEWIGLVSMADKLHDATLPPNALSSAAAVGGRLRRIVRNQFDGDAAISADKNF